MTVDGFIFSMIRRPRLRTCLAVDVSSHSSWHGFPTPMALKEGEMVSHRHRSQGLAVGIEAISKSACPLIGQGHCPIMYYTIVTPTFKTEYLSG
jgi:hypothetical protein